MLEQFTVENFKGFKKLTLDDLGHINIFVGKNNTGKTSLLQAVGLSRLKGHTFDNSWLKKLVCLLLSGAESIGKEYKLIQNIFNIKQSILNTRCSFKDSEEDMTDYVIGLTLNRNRDNSTLSFTQTFLSANTKMEQEVIIPSSKPFFRYALSEMTDSIFSSNFPMKAFTAFQYAELSLDNKKRESLLEELQKIEPSLKDIRLSSGDEMFCDIGLPKLLPIDNMGDGFIKLFALLCFLEPSEVSCDDVNITLIDEPENGFHYSVQSQFWQLLATAGLEHGKQSFIATHSYELLESLNTLLNENPDLTKPVKEGGQGLKVRVYELQRVGEHLQVVKIDQEVMSILIKHGSDFRG
ncbi:MAG: AAA family ATPase [Candidatus Melainabacteria bacterium]|jgi:AAA15 family ATPase/GTPase|nr:AAA family ATPase [Candidatus Melainabacteria bacterium]